jgi:hypothetical protein
MRVLFQQFVHQPHSKKAGRARDKDKFFTSHAEANRSVRTTKSTPGAEVV